MRLIDEDGFIVAANLIGGTIQEKIGRKKEIWEGLERWYQNISSINI